MKKDQSGPVSTPIEGLDSQYAPAVQALDKLVRSWQPQLEVKLWQSMGYPIIGYGQASYRLSSGRINDWFIVGLAAHKSYLSLYVWGVVDGQYLLDHYQGRLGRVKTGRACLNFKDLDDLDLKTLKEAIQRAVDLQAGAGKHRPKSLNANVALRNEIQGPNIDT